MHVDISQKVVLVTGGTGGLGSEICLRCVDEGAQVAAVYHRNGEKAEGLIQSGVSAVFSCNVTDSSGVEHLFDNVMDRFGRVDCLVNCAGVTRDRITIRMGNEEWKEVMNTHVKGVFNCSRAVLRHMVHRRKGSIVNIVSIAGLKGTMGQSNYSAAKAAVIGFTKSVAREYGKYGIRINAVCPGFFHSGMTSHLPDEVKAEKVAENVLGRMSLAEEAADFIIFLMSERAGGISGQVFNIDGRII